MICDRPEEEDSTDTENDEERMGWRNDTAEANKSWNKKQSAGQEPRFSNSQSSSSVPQTPEGKIEIEDKSVTEERIVAKCNITITM